MGSRRDRAGAVVAAIPGRCSRPVGWVGRWPPRPISARRTGCGRRTTPRRRSPRPFMARGGHSTSRWTVLSSGAVEASAGLPSAESRPPEDNLDYMVHISLSLPPPVCHDSPLERVRRPVSSPARMTRVTPRSEPHNRAKCRRLRAGTGPASTRAQRRGAEPLRLTGDAPCLGARSTNEWRS